jgi:hypothetical protein
LKVVTIDASKKKADYEAWVESCKKVGIKPAAPDIEVRLHGKQLILLGEWTTPDYSYAAVREVGSKNTDYHLIHPRYIK